MPAFRVDWPWPAPGDLTPEEQVHMEGPVDAAFTFLGLLKAGQFTDAWALADPEWRLARVQLYLWLAREAFADFGADLDEEAAGGASPAPDTWWWSRFAQRESELWAEMPFDPETWGAGNRPRPYDIDYEAVVLIDTGGQRVDDVSWKDEPDRIEVLLHLVDRRWLVAAIDHRYRPGWPPTLEDGTPAG